MCGEERGGKNKEMFLPSHSQGYNVAAVAGDSLLFWSPTLYTDWDWVGSDSSTIDFGSQEFEQIPISLKKNYWMNEYE